MSAPTVTRESAGKPSSASRNRLLAAISKNLEAEDWRGLCASAAKLLETEQSGAGSVLPSLWRALEPTLLTDPPEPRRWLLRHPDPESADIGANDGSGLLPLGKVGVLSAEGGAGKTSVLVALALSVATGRPWLGHFRVDEAARRGRVLLALGEEDEEEVHRRLYAASEALGLDGESRKEAASFSARQNGPTCARQDGPTLGSCSRPLVTRR